jgi:Protein of unknown function (DUF2510)
VSAKAGWYPDPGGGVGLYRYWDGKAWSAATSAHPSAPPPSAPLGSGASGTGQPQGYSSAGDGTTGGPAGYGFGPGGHGPGSPGPGGSGPGGYGPGSSGPGGSGSGGYGPGGYGPGDYGTGAGSYGGYPGQNAYAAYQQQTKKRTPVGWWIGAAALLVVIVVVAVVAIRAIGSSAPVGNGTGGGGQQSEQVCPPETSVTSPIPHPNDGRVYGGPLSYPMLGAPWGPPQTDDRVPFGSDVSSQVVLVEPNYQPGANWVASILIGELQAGDGFFTPEQGSQIVVRCILGKFYGDNPVNSDVQVNQAATIDGHEGWLVESHLTFNIAGLDTKGELLIVAIVSAGARAGLYYASIPDTTPELVPTARDVLQELRVED